MGAAPFHPADGVLQDRQGRRVISGQLRGAQKGDFQSVLAADRGDLLIVGGQDYPRQPAGGQSYFGSIRQ